MSVIIPISPLQPVLVPHNDSGLFSAAEKDANSKDSRCGFSCLSVDLYFAPCSALRLNVHTKFKLVLKRALGGRVDFLSLVAERTYPQGYYE